MIKSIHIRNFQAHKDTLLELHDGVNVITGASDSGKSSIIRAIRWSHENRPAGDSFRNWDCEEEKVSVVITTKDNLRISKSRSKTNSYTLGRKTFDVLKAEVPQEILDAFDLSEYNIRSQHQPYFLLSDSPGEVARKLNEIAGLDIIDKIFKNLNSKILASKRGVVSQTETIKTLTEDIDKLSYIDAADADLSIIESLLVKREKMQKRVGSVRNLIENIIAVNEEIDRSKTLRGLEKQAKELKEQIADQSSRKGKLTTIKTLVSNISTIREDLQTELNWLEIEKEIAPLRKRISERNTRKLNTDKLKILLKEIQDIRRQIIIQEGTFLALKADKEAFMKKHKVCPLCGGKFK